MFVQSSQQDVTSACPIVQLLYKHPIIYDDYELWSSHYTVFSGLCYSLPLRPQELHSRKSSAYFFSLKVRDQVSHSCKTAHKITIVWSETTKYCLDEVGVSQTVRHNTYLYIAVNALRFSVSCTGYCIWEAYMKCTVKYKNVTLYIHTVIYVYIPTYDRNFCVVKYWSSFSCTVTFYNAEDVGLACWEAYTYGQLFESQIKINTEDIILHIVL